MRSRSPYCWIAMIAAGAALPATAPAIPGDLEGIVAHLGFDRSEVEDLLDGDVILLDEDLKEGSDKEMAIGAAVLLPTTLAKAAEILRSRRGFEISDPPVAADFAAVRYTRKEWEEVEALLEVKAGSTFNLSAGEISRFQGLGRRLDGRKPKEDASVREAAAEQLRVMLLERCNAYRAGGLGAIAPYDRGDGAQVSAGVELGFALAQDVAQDARLAALAGEFQKAVLRYPAPLPDGIRSEFFWTKADVADRPCLALTHRLSRVDAGAALVVERQFYVGHDYNSLQVVMTAIPTERGILLYYRNRTFTDQVAGRVGSAKKVIGRRRQRNAVVGFLEGLRAAAE